MHQLDRVVTGKGLERLRIAVGRPPSDRTPRAFAGARDPDRHWSGCGALSQGARPRRRRDGASGSLHLTDLASLSQARQVDRGTPALALSEGHLHGRFLRGACGALGARGAGALGLDHCPPQGGLARRAGALATARSLGQAAGPRQPGLSSLDRPHCPPHTAAARRSSWTKAGRRGSSTLHKQLRTSVPPMSASCFSRSSIGNGAISRPSVMSTSGPSLCRRLLLTTALGPPRLDMTSNVMCVIITPACGAATRARAARTAAGDSPE